MELEDWLDDLCVRFIINLPSEELESVERICFQLEEAQWFYEDFIRPLDPSLPSLSLKAFSLRIFQHCPLFSEWSTDSYTAAFAEFLAYKSRVPVRGAIMLNEEMDQVVLVKGWKKGANWSFPRGKINKDEDDLDCAVREVFEETGFDIKAAGLVKEAKDMKYIEVAMREQHMRLYVFRGVPMDTYFEPRTRKEISKIEWYKLTDLPTLKKNRQQEGVAEHLASANKFYMVAPFLVPLKKWISQQRKRENRVISTTIPIVAEEPLTDYGAGLIRSSDQPANGPSDLPEVSQNQASPFDPPWHLKQPLNVEKHMEPDRDIAPSKPHVDTAKSHALLNLLRNGSHPDIPNVSKPNTPLDQVTFAHDISRSPHPHHPPPAQFSTLPSPPRFPISSFRAPSDAAESRTQAPIPLPSDSASVLDSSANNTRRQQVPAPYRITGDPEFSHSYSKPSSGPRVPPANALPPLTHHKQALLDVFKSALSPTPGPLHTAAPPSDGGQTSRSAVPASTPVDHSSLLPTRLGNRAKTQSHGEKDPKQVAIDQRLSLLGIFQNVPSPASEMSPGRSSPKGPAPVELAASSAPGMPRKEQPPSRAFTKSVEQKPPTFSKSVSQVNGVSGKGLTSATISGPLNQPQFEGIVNKSPRQSSLSNGHVRSPAPPHRTLFDPSQDLQKGQPSRAAGAEHSSARSLRPIKLFRSGLLKTTTAHAGDSAKPFQPQILRRPTADQKDPPLQSIAQPTLQTGVDASRLQPPKSSASPTQTSRESLVDGHKVQSDSQKQALLSLFGIPPPQSSTVIPPPAPGSTTIGAIAREPTPTGSQLASRVNIVTAESYGRTPGEKPQTAPGDKAFLLGYLGRIANQEG